MDALRISRVKRQASGYGVDLSDVDLSTSDGIKLASIRAMEACGNLAERVKQSEIDALDGNTLYGVILYGVNGLWPMDNRTAAGMSDKSHLHARLNALRWVRCTRRSAKRAIGLI